MIISRTPYRISFVGGGSDLPAFYRHSPGCVLSTTINKYMYLSIHPHFHAEQIQLKYSKTELVSSVDDVAHPIARVILRRFGLSGVSIDSIADIPHGTGLGSSSSFAVGLLHSVYAYLGKYVSRERLAAEACEIEIGMLGEPIGKQDQYASAYGGMNLVTFYADESVNVEPVFMPSGDKGRLEDNLMLFYTGESRPSRAVLTEQRMNTEEGRVTELLRQMADMARKLRLKLCDGDIDSVGYAMHEGWMLKKRLASTISNPEIDGLYQRALDNGAVGGKLLGAGGGGFLLLYVYPDAHERMRKALGGLKEVGFGFDNGGTKIIYVGEKP